MKTIIISVFLNLILVTSTLYYIGTILESTSTKILIFFVLSGVCLPLIGILFNTIFQNKLNTTLSNIYVSIISSILLIIPIEIFKTLDKVIYAQKILNGKTLGDRNSAITIDIDLSFNLSSYIIVIFIWVLIGSLLGVIADKVKKNATVT